MLGKIAASNLGVGTSHGVFRDILKLVYGFPVLEFNGPLWFLPALFVTKILYRFLCVWICENKRMLVVLTILGCGFSFWWTNNDKVPLPMSLELVLKLFPFFLAGILCKSLLVQIGNSEGTKFKLLVVASMLLSLTCVSAAFAPPCNYTNNEIPIPGVFYGIAFLGCIGLYCLSVSIQYVDWIGFLGRKSLSVLVMHKFPVVFFQIIGPFEMLLKQPDTIEGILGAMIVTAISIIACIIVGCWIEKYCPILLGRPIESADVLKQVR